MKAPEYGINCLFRCPKQANLAAGRQGRREATSLSSRRVSVQKSGAPRPNRKRDTEAEHFEETSENDGE